MVEVHNDIWQDSTEEAERFTINFEKIAGRPLVEGQFAIDPEKEGQVDAEQVFKIVWLDEQKSKCTIYISYIDTSEIPQDSMSELVARKRRSSDFNDEGTANSLMLPEKYTFDTFSFLENQERPSLTVEFNYDLTSSEVSEAAMYLSKSINRRQLTFEQADTLIEQEQAVAGVPLHDHLRVADSLYERAHVFGRNYYKKSPSERIVGQFISAGNEHAARIVLEKNMVVLFNNYVRGNFLDQDFPSPHLAMYTIGDNQPVYHEDPEVHAKMAEEMATFDTMKSQLITDRLVVGPESYGNLGVARLRLSAPVREYISFVNMRMVVAQLSGQEVPYSREELSSIYVWLNSHKWEETLEKDLHNQVKNLRSSIRDISERWDLPVNFEDGPTVYEELLALKQRYTKLKIKNAQLQAVDEASVPEFELADYEILDDKADYRQRRNRLSLLLSPSREEAPKRKYQDAPIGSLNKLVKNRIIRRKKDPQLCEEIRERIASGTISASIISRLLFQAPLPEMDWEKLLDDVDGWLADPQNVRIVGDVMDIQRENILETYLGSRFDRVLKRNINSYRISWSEESWDAAAETQARSKLKAREQAAKIILEKRVAYLRETFVEVE